MSTDKATETPQAVPAVGPRLDRRVRALEPKRDGLRAGDINKKPTRAMLLRVVEDLQRLVGQAAGLHSNDRDQHAFEKAQKVLEEAHDLCIQARNFDPAPAIRWARRERPNVRANLETPDDH